MALTGALLGVRVLVLVAALDAMLGRAVDAVALRMVSSDHGKSRCQRKRTDLQRPAPFQKHGQSGGARFGSAGSDSSPDGEAAPGSPQYVRPSAKAQLPILC